MQAGFEQPLSITRIRDMPCSQAVNAIHSRVLSLKGPVLPRKLVKGGGTRRGGEDMADSVMDTAGIGNTAYTRP